MYLKGRNRKTEIQYVVLELSWEVLNVLHISELN